MSEQPYDDENDQTDEHDEQEQRDNVGIRSLRKKAKDYDTVSQERDTLRRELAFTKAGLSTEDDPRLSYFIKGYDGDLTKDAIRAEAAKAGFIDPDEPADPVETESGAERVMRASAGATPSTAGLITPADAAQWAPDKFRRFMQSHPEHAESLLRGQPVSGVTY